MDELKKAYAKFHSPELTAQRKYRADNPHIVDFDKHILGTAKEASKKGKPEGIINPGWRIINQLHSNFDYHIERCAEMGLTLEPVYLGSHLIHYKVSGWA